MLPSLRTLIATQKPFKGRQRLLQLTDKCFGPISVSPRDYKGKLLLYPSSTQDCAFLQGSRQSNVPLETLLEALPASATFMDIGANAGYYSLWAASRLNAEGTLVSVEPSPREFYRLAYAKYANPHKCRWEILNAACGKDALVSLKCNNAHTGLNHIEAEPSDEESLTVRSISIDRLFEELHLTSVTLLKVDVEGWEHSVLNGAKETLLRRQIKTVCVEVTEKYLSRAGSSKAALYSLMTSCGYKGTTAQEGWQYDEIFVPADA